MNTSSNRQERSNDDDYKSCCNGACAAHTDCCHQDDQGRMDTFLLQSDCNGDVINDNSRNHNHGQDAWKEALEAFFLKQNHTSNNSNDVDQDKLMLSNKTSLPATYKEQQLLRKASTTLTTTRFNHVQQFKDWDCGVACLLMILRWLRINNDNEDDVSTNNDNVNPNNDARSNSSDETYNLASSDQYSIHLNDQELQLRRWIMDILRTESIWTADLVYVLHQVLEQLQVKQPSLYNPHSLLYCSNTFKVNESLQDLQFYHLEFCRDRKRVQERLQCLRNNKNVQMLQCNNLSMDRVKSLVQHPLVMAIILVDDNVLRKSIKSAYSAAFTSNVDVKITTKTTSTTTIGFCIDDNNNNNNGVNVDYIGHYVILAGTSTETEDLEKVNCCCRHHHHHDYCWIVYNPALANGKTYMCPSLLEQAWRAVGTDEDIVFVAKHAAI